MLNPIAAPSGRGVGAELLPIGAIGGTGAAPRSSPSGKVGLVAIMMPWLWGTQRYQREGRLGRQTRRRGGGMLDGGSGAFPPLPSPLLEKQWHFVTK